MKERYVVAYDSKFSDSGAILFLVDRKRIKNKWGSILLEDAIVLGSIKRAEALAKSMKFGNPRVYTYEDALNFAANMESSFMKTLDNDDPSWDSHKEFF